ncbi:MAG: hypothetical protein K6C13_05440, partial [Oscillospiraceae bacterium]|nr:hypothetical protein [Oscillospiraceae bacterium]
KIICYGKLVKILDPFLLRSAAAHRYHLPSTILYSISPEKSIVFRENRRAGSPRGHVALLISNSSSVETAFVMQSARGDISIQIKKPLPCLISQDSSMDYYLDNVPNADITEQLLFTDNAIRPRGLPAS